MSDTFWIVIGGVVVLLAALLLGRYVKIKYGDHSIEAGEQKRASMTVSATGSGSSVTRVKQTQTGAPRGSQDVSAAKGGKIDDVEQNRSG